jgi:hypothetical protein
VLNKVIYIFNVAKRLKTTPDQSAPLDPCPLLIIINPVIIIDLVLAITIDV